MGDEEMTQMSYEILGAKIVSELTGADPAPAGGLNAQFGINAAAELLTRGLATAEAKSAEKKSAAASEAATNKALSADVNWANAEVMLETANLSKDPQKIAAAQSLQMSAMAAAQSAGAGLTPDGAAKRIETANAMAKQAAEASLADSKNGASQPPCAPGRRSQRRPRRRPRVCRADNRRSTSSRRKLGSRSSTS
jgi:hypothetical protein